MTAPAAEARQLDLLAAHWLSDTALDACREKVHPSKLEPSSLLQRLPPGAFVVVLYVDQDASRYRPAVPVVLQWFDSTSDHPPTKLPRGLQELALSVHRACGDSKKPFTLREVPGFDQWLAVLERWKVTGWDSAYASLAATLLATRNNHAPDRYVAATACRRDSRFAAVDGIDEKLAAFERLGVKTVFVAEGQTSSTPTRMQVAALPSRGQVLQDLVPMLKHLITKPQLSDPFEVRVAYFDALRRIGAGKTEETFDFYLSCLLPDLADRLRRQAVDAETLKGLFATGVERGLVCIDTREFTLNLLLFEAIKPKAWILLHLDAIEKLELLQWIRRRRRGFEPILISMTNPEWPRELERAMSRDGAPEITWVADVTGGKSQAKLDVYRVCVEQGVRTLVVDSETPSNDRSTGTERLIAIGHPSRRGDTSC